MKYYISDLHLEDQNVFEKCWKYRYFKDLDDYAEKIIKNWNSVVTDMDEIYVLGDIAEGHFEKVISILKQLKGQKHLIVGNHDIPLRELFEKSGIFQSVQDNSLIEDNGRKIHLSHYPLMDWMEFSREGYLIYGHIHNKTPEQNPAYRQIKEYYADKLAFNASCDVIGYTPRTLDELINLKKQNTNEAFIN